MSDAQGPQVSRSYFGEAFDALSRCRDELAARHIAAFTESVEHLVAFSATLPALRERIAAGDDDAYDEWAASSNQQAELSGRADALRGAYALIMTEINVLIDTFRDQMRLDMLSKHTGIEA